MADLLERIVSRLRTLGVEHRVLRHEAATTSSESARARGTALRTGAKALTVKADDRMLLCVLPADRKLDWKSVKRLTRARSVRLATEDEMFRETGLVKGSVPPFGNLLSLPVYVDPDLLGCELVRFNAGSLTESVEMPGNRLLEAVEGRQATIARKETATSDPSSPDAGASAPF